MIINPADNWDDGQTFTLRPGGDLRDFDYSVTFDIACNNPRGAALRAPGGNAFTDTRTQINWRWCRKCQGLWYAGPPHQWTQRMVTSNCPAGGLHTLRGSGNYALIHNSSDVRERQNGWRWCWKCQGLFYGRNHPNGSGICPQGGQHDSRRSGNYGIVHNTPRHQGQDRWRWCRNCEGLWFSGHPGSVCPDPANARHSSNGSGAYKLLNGSS